MIRIFITFYLLIAATMVQAGNDSKETLNRDNAIFLITNENHSYFKALIDATDGKAQTTEIRNTNDDQYAVKKYCLINPSRGGVDGIVINRQLTEKEKARCKANNSGDFVEIYLGEKVPVFVAEKSTPMVALTRKNLYRAFAQDVFEDPSDSRSFIIPNPFKQWSDMDKTLPKNDINLILPSQDSTSYDSFKNVAQRYGCQQYDYIADMQYSQRFRSWFRTYCFDTRDDVTAVPAKDEKTGMVDRIIANKGAMGVLNFADWLNQTERLQVLPVEGVLPTLDSIKDGSYPLTRPVYAYIKKENLAKVSGLKNIYEAMISKSAIGERTNMGLLQTVPADKIVTHIKIKK